MSQLSLVLKNSDSTIFYEEDLVLIDKLTLPTICRFLRADKFDSKFFRTTDDVWDFNYSGKRVNISFQKLNKYENKLAKYFLVNYIQVNTPSALDVQFQTFHYVIKDLKSNNLKLDYSSLKSMLINLAKDQNNVYYYNLKFLVKLLFLDDFLNFDINQEYELEFLERPKSFNSKLYYQQYEDPIDYPFISMIQQGFIKLNQDIKSSSKQVDNQNLLYASILGLIYVTGLRPVQLAKLSAENIKIDTTRTVDQFHRYSILIPYAKLY